MSQLITLSAGFLENKVFTHNGHTYKFNKVEVTGRIKVTHIESGMRISMHPDTMINLI